MIVNMSFPDVAWTLYLSACVFYVTWRIARIVYVGLRVEKSRKITV